MTAEPEFAVGGCCYRCGSPGHWQHECPLLIPAASKAEHEGRIALFVSRWIAGEMTRLQKRQAVKQENEMWKTGGNS